MAAATEAIKRKESNPQLIREPIAVVKTGETIYKGTLAFLDANGKAVASGNYKLAGYAVETYEAGETGVFYWGSRIKLIKADASESDLGKIAYATDNQTATLSANNAIIGPISKWESGYVYADFVKMAS